MSLSGVGGVFLLRIGSEKEKKSKCVSGSGSGESTREDGPHARA